MKSNFTDSIKLVLSDNYNIPDSSYKKLSGILLRSGMSESALDSGIVQLINIVIKNNLTFPISLNLLKSFWSTEGVAFNFVHTLSSLVVDDIIKLKKVKREKFLRDDIMKGNDEYDDRDLYVVVYSTEKFDTIYKGFEEILKTGEVSEGVSFKDNVPKKFLNVFNKASKLLNEYNVPLKIESYIYDDVTGIAKVNMILSNTSEYGCKDNVIQRVAKKYIGKVKGVVNVESFIDSPTELFLNVDLTVKEVSNDLAFAISSFVRELEVDYAK